MSERPPKKALQAKGQPSPGEQEKVAREFLARKRYRKARDTIKLLCKIDREKYLPLLIEANLGLAGEMLDKGQVSEAQQVIDYLKSIAAPEQVCSLELRLARRSGNIEQAATTSLSLLIEGLDSLSEPEKLLAADEIIVSFQTVSANTPAGQRLGVEADAIQESLKAICEERFPEALELIRPLSSTSIFSHWKLLIKGLASFYGDQKTKAANAFQRIPVDTAPGKVAAAGLLLLREGHPSFIEARECNLICGLLGHPNLGKALFQAEALWRNGRYEDSYRSLRDSWPEFPSEDIDFPGLLTRFYFNSLHALSSGRGAQFAEHFDQSIIRGRTKNLIEKKWILRTLGLYYEQDLEPHPTEEYWSKFIALEEQLRGRNPRLNSLAWCWLGKAFVQTVQPTPYPFFFGTPPREDNPEAIQAFEQSIAEDPTNLEAHLKLCELYTHLRKTKQRNRLLDSMTERFPDRKEVLFQAGMRCLDRKVYIKGLDYLEKAMAIDRLDPTLPDAIMIGLILLLRQNYRKGKAAQVAKTWDRMEPLLVDQADNYTRSRWTVLLRRGILERAHGNAALGEQLLQEARSVSPFPAAFLLFRQIAHSIYAPRPKDAARHANANEWSNVCKNEATAEHAAKLLRIFGYWCQSDEYMGTVPEQRWIRKYLKAAAKRPFNREDAAQLLELAEQYDEFEREIGKFVNLALKDDPSDPLFRFHRMFGPNGQHFGYDEVDRKTLKEILEEANRRNDIKTARRAQTILDELRPPPPPIPLPPVEPIQKTSPGNDAVDLQELLSGDITDTAAMLEVLAMLEGLSNSQVRWLRKKMKKDLPGPVFDKLVELARLGPPSSPPPIPDLPMPLDTPLAPNPTPQRRVPPQPRDDPNQLNLF